MKVLFVCVHNAGRSQMAEALFNRAAQSQGIASRAMSAGTLGGGRINPVVAQAMAEIAVPLDGQTPKALTPEMVSWAERIVSMGCGVNAEACPTKFLVAEDWGLDDPAGQSLEVVRRIRDEVAARVDELVARLRNQPDNAE